MAAGLRLFLGIKPPSQVVIQLRDLVTRLRASFARAKVSWVRQENMHLTIKFLGQVPIEAVSRITGEMAFLSDFNVFELELGDCGTFPPKGKPSVLWIGTKPSKKLDAIREKIAERMESLGFALEQRPFFPHFTLGRIRHLSHNPTSPKYVDPKTVSEFRKTLFKASFHVTDVRLYQSKLISAGTTYVSLETCKLKHV